LDGPRWPARVIVGQLVGDDCTNAPPPSQERQAGLTETKFAKRWSDDREVDHRPESRLGRGHGRPVVRKTGHVVTVVAKPCD